MTKKSHFGYWLSVCESINKLVCAEISLNCERVGMQAGLNTYTPQLVKCNLSTQRWERNTHPQPCQVKYFYTASQRMGKNYTQKPCQVKRFYTF